MGYLCVESGLKVRTALSNAICRKAFAMAHIHAEDAADVVNFMASDLMKVYNGMQVGGGSMPSQLWPPAPGRTSTRAVALLLYHCCIYGCRSVTKHFLLTSTELVIEAPHRCRNRCHMAPP